jgi:nitroreductase
VKDKTKIGALAGTLRAWLKQAPVVAVACADPKGSGSHDGMDYYLIDVGISMQQLILAATNFGFGTCWIGSFDEAKIKKTLGVPDNVKVVAMTPIGYPAEKEGVGNKLIKTLIGSDKRKPLEDMVHWDKW